MASYPSTVILRLLNSAGYKHESHFSDAITRLIQWYLNKSTTDWTSHNISINRKNETFQVFLRTWVWKFKFTKLPWLRLKCLRVVMMLCICFSFHSDKGFWSPNSFLSSLGWMWVEPQCLFRHYSECRTTYRPLPSASTLLSFKRSARFITTIWIFFYQHFVVCSRKTPHQISRFRSFIWTRFKFRWPLRGFAWRLLSLAGEYIKIEQIARQWIPCHSDFPSFWRSFGVTTPMAAVLVQSSMMTMTKMLWRGSHVWAYAQVSPSASPSLCRGHSCSD